MERDEMDLGVEKEEMMVEDKYYYLTGWLQRKNFEAAS